ncbi:siderophore-interacting protein [Cupriavidus taiwanensis]|uniref:siderophore-interacting protein n=1 Tax=Cupriavidus taiwanensis TaxID=164546 RepID=UPI000E12B958|nr:siderophore-interacting protein [Cupriavidus taiwanensis]SOY61286.1 Siderophore-interacting protein [Cupriavidus taiwanensis]SOY98001.1 Siderophore-interacting protein [Cupriavidus taiwanensis]SOZ68322.1 Siderophore-interacting protein [Cupriavidus taiwanensis]SOZ84921.1 Siderophore-interacting protein [Cupriavidus taiwanensis]SOZ88148.1 Siderophore-interacting protein [Cupriavidus taiwanensis]
MTENATEPARNLAVERVRHPLKMRLLQVLRTTQVSPQLLRVTLGGADLQDFVSASFDDHVKVFFPAAGDDKPVLPQVTADGIVFPEGQPRPAARDYTPRRYDAAAQELDLEFVLHGDGPASTWAAQARPGQYLGVGGPRGSFVVPTAFDWHLLIGDDTALPAIGRRLEELGEESRAVVVMEVGDATAQIALPSRAKVEVHWLHRGDAPEGSLLEAALRQVTLPQGEGYVWAAGEAAAMKAVRQYLVGERGIDKKRIRASAYWKRGDAAVHQTLDD